MFLFRLIGLFSVFTGLPLACSFVVPKRWGRAYSSAAISSPVWTPEKFNSTSTRRTSELERWTSAVTGGWSAGRHGDIEQI